MLDYIAVCLAHGVRQRTDPVSLRSPDVSQLGRFLPASIHGDGVGESWSLFQFGCGAAPTGLDAGNDTLLRGLGY